jgi:mannose-1-phosphate guanylyltransferase
LPDEDFFIINGDTLTTVDLHSLAENHRNSGALVTIAVIPNEWPDRYGGLVVDANGRFHGVVPRGSKVRSQHVVGVQVAHPSAFTRLPPNEPADSIGGLYKTLIKEDPGHVRAHLCSSEFWDVGTSADYLATCLEIGRKEGSHPQIGKRSIIEDSARVIDSVIWDDVVVSENAMLQRCVVADGVNIPSGASFRDSAIVQTDGELIVADIK